MNRKQLRYLLVAVALCLPLWSRPARADAPPFAQVKDINTAPEPQSGLGGGGALFQPLGGTVIFSAYTPADGHELWRTDGSEAGTQLVKDIQPGEGSALGPYDTPSQLLGGGLLLAADDGALGSELWRTDGTPEGTALLRDLWPGAESGYPYNFTVAGGRAFFQAQVGPARNALWITDGTPGGTTLLKVFGNIQHFALVGGALFFSATDSGNNYELWRSDGTPAGTVMLKDIYPGAQGSFPRDLVELSPGWLLFSAEDNAHGRELWRSDGTPAGTQLVYDIPSASRGSEPYGLLPIQTTNIVRQTSYSALFAATATGSGTELWATDGFTTTALVADVFNGPQGSDPSPRAMNTCSALGYTRSCPLFEATDEVYGRELWAYDGSGGLALLKDINPTGNSDAGYLMRMGDTFFFSANEPSTGRELWRTNGTPGGTAQVANIAPGNAHSHPQSLVAFGGKLFFTAENQAYGRELWRTDGTPEGTTMVKDINPNGKDGAYWALGEALGALFFVADDGAHGGELWRTDGTPEGTTMVKNIAPDDGGIALYAGEDAAPLGDRLAFSLQLGPPDTADAALWVSDGTAQGTATLRSFSGFGYDNQPLFLTAAGGGVLFTANTTKDVRELWRSDGSEAGTGVLTPTVAPGPGFVESVWAFDERALFSVYTSTSQLNERYSLWATDGTPGGTRTLNTGVVCDSYEHAASGDTLFLRCKPLAKYSNDELWRSDGTPQGTALVKEITGGDTGSYPRTITAGAPGQAFFVADVGSTGYQLWVSDGTEGGTRLVFDPQPVKGVHDFGDEMAYADGKVFFVANDGVNGWELWRSDGTPAGTAMVADLFPGPGSSEPSGLVALSGSVYFAATGPDGRRTLWRGDGTPVGTRPVRDDGQAPLNPDGLRAVDGQVLFSAADAAHGRELWVSDGTPAGTGLYQDIAPGAASSNPQTIIEAGRQVFLTAETRGSGRELWALSPDAPTEATPQPTEATPRPTEATPRPSPDVRRVYLPMVRR